MRRLIWFPVLAALVGCGEQGVTERTIPKGVEASPRQGLGAGQEPGSGVDGSGEEGRPEAGGEVMRDMGTHDWVLPDGWRLLTESRPMRVATFFVEAPSGVVEVAVTRFDGQTGGLAANINRWRTQLGLEAIATDEAEASVDRFEREGWSGYALRIRGGSAHTLAAGVYEQAADRTWFVRATLAPGDADAIEAAFMAFARSIGAPSGT